jgi:hypothetical protein
VPATRPPRRFRGTPCRRVLPAGTELHRVHQRRHPSWEFVPRERVADPHFGGGRFDPTDEDAYPYLYAGFGRATALAERLLRGIPCDDRGARVLPRAEVEGRRLSSLRLATDLTLLALTTSKELAAVGQDQWLVQAEADEYGKTRRWAHWLRRQAPWAQGLVWPSKREVGEEAVILFGDRCQPGELQAALLPPIDLDTPEGCGWLNEVLADYHVTLRRPARRKASQTGSRARAPGV